MRKTIVFLFFLAVLSLGVSAQTEDDIKAPSETATRADLEKWLTQALGKYGKYKNRTTSVSIWSAKVEGCTLKFNVLHKPNTIDNASDRTVFATKKVTQSVAIDLSRIASDGVSLEDCLDPELRAVVVRLGDGTKTDIVVRGEAASAARSVLERLRSMCTSAP